MKRSVRLLLGTYLLLGSALALAADWGVNSISKQSTDMPGEATTADAAGKFLHIRLDVTGTSPNWSQFKVVNEQGETIAAPAGYNPKQSLVIFEGDWTNMIGRYLENGDVRVPLFQKEAPLDAAPQEVVKQTPVVTEYREPVVVQDAPVVREYREPVVVHETPVIREKTVHVYDDHRDVVHHHHGDRVVHHQGDRVVHHHDGYVAAAHHHTHGHVVGHRDDCGCKDCLAVSHGAGCGCGACGGGHGGGALAGAGSPWEIDPLGRTLGMAATLAMGDTPGTGMGPGSGPGTGPGPGSGPGDGSGSGDGSGEGDCGDGSGETGDSTDPAEGPGPEEGPNPNEPLPADKYGEGEGNGNGNGMGNSNRLNHMVNLAPQFRQRVRNLAPKLKLPKVPVIYGPDLLVYNPQIPYWNPQLPYYQPGYGYGGGGGGGYGDGGGYGGVSLDGATIAPMPMMPPGMVLYISCGDGNSEGKVYQVDEQGRILGVVNLPETATGIAMHRDYGLICVVPNGGGKVYRIDDGGKVELILEKDEKMLHPVDVAVPVNSDSIVLVDNIADTISLTNISGKKLDTYKKLEAVAEEDSERMSVAVGRDRAILYGTDGNRGIYRFSGNAALTGSAPVLPEPGGVAADPASDRWAATQGSNKVVIMEGESQVQTYTLPGGKRLYQGGLLSFAPAAGIAETAPGTGIVVAMRDASDTSVAPYLMEFKTNEEGKVDQRLLFQWENDRMVDFVVGPRMKWERNHRETYKGKF